jgi:hypothetical protein
MKTIRNLSSGAVIRVSDSSAYAAIKSGTHAYVNKKEYEKIKADAGPLFINRSRLVELKNNTIKAFSLTDTVKICNINGFRGIVGHYLPHLEESRIGFIIDFDGTLRCFVASIKMVNGSRSHQNSSAVEIYNVSKSSYDKFVEKGEIDLPEELKTEGFLVSYYENDIAHMLIDISDELRRPISKLTGHYIEFD